MNQEVQKSALQLVGIVISILLGLKALVPVYVNYRKKSLENKLKGQEQKTENETEKDKLSAEAQSFLQETSKAYFEDLRKEKNLSQRKIERSEQQVMALIDEVRMTNQDREQMKTQVEIAKRDILDLQRELYDSKNQYILSENKSRDFADQVRMLLEKVKNLELESGNTRTELKLATTDLNSVRMNMGTLQEALGREKESNYFLKNSLELANQEIQNVKNLLTQALDENGKLKITIQQKTEQIRNMEEKSVKVTGQTISPVNPIETSTEVLKNESSQSNPHN